MGNSVFDYDNGDFIFIGSDNIAFTSNGNMMMKISDNMAIDMGSGDLHTTSSWSSDYDD